MSNKQKKNSVYKFDAEEAKNKCVQWIRNWFETNGPDCNVIVGISGGVDSSVVTALCVEALGKDRVIGVAMPNNNQSDIQDSYDLIQHLGIKYMNVNIGSIVRNLSETISITSFNRIDKDGNRVDSEWIKISEQTQINLPARIRMVTLYAISQSVNGRVVNTCNLSEDWIGYSTKYGDAAGDFSPLANFTKTEVKAIAYSLGLPKHLIEKAPSDGLCGQSDEGRFGFTYDVLDRYIRTGIINDITIKDKIDTMHKQNLFKLQQMDSFPWGEIFCVT